MSEACERGALRARCQPFRRRVSQTGFADRGFSQGLFRSTRSRVAPPARCGDAVREQCADHRRSETAATTRGRLAVYEKPERSLRSTSGPGCGVFLGGVSRGVSAGGLTDTASAPNICMMTQASKSEETTCGGTSDFDRLFPTELFRALSDANRIALLGHLATGCGPQTVTEASGCCPTDISVTSRHLAILRNAGIVEAQKRGREVLYTVRYLELSKALRAMADAIDTCCPEQEPEQEPNEQPREA